ncbi:MAG: hypothetical protein Tsb0013_10460 [Phycisphaerales bacterium]
MVPILDLWLPIVLSTVIVFIASAVAWMAIPKWHQPDLKVLPDEATFAGDLGRHELAPGQYMWPNCGSSEEMKSDEFKRRWAEGPWGLLRVAGTRPSFGVNLVVTFVYFLVVSVVVGFLASRAFGSGAGYYEVFGFCFLASALAHCTMNLPNSMFLMEPRRWMLTNLIDGFVFAMLTAGTFAGLWPEAAGQAGV